LDKTGRVQTPPVTSKDFGDTIKEGAVDAINTGSDVVAQIAKDTPSNQKPWWLKAEGDNKSLYDDYTEHDKADPKAFLSNMTGTALGMNPEGVPVEMLRTAEHVDNAIPEKLEEQGVNPMLAQLASPSSLIPILKPAKSMSLVSSGLKEAKALKIAEEAAKAAKLAEEAKVGSLAARETMATSDAARLAVADQEATGRSLKNRFKDRAAVAEPKGTEVDTAGVKKRLSAANPEPTAPAKPENIEGSLKRKYQKKPKEGDIYNETPPVVGEPSVEDLPPVGGEPAIAGAIPETPIAPNPATQAAQGQQLPIAPAPSSVAVPPAPATEGTMSKIKGFWDKYKTPLVGTSAVAGGYAGTKNLMERMGNEVAKESTPPTPPPPSQANNSVTGEPPITPARSPQAAAIQNTDPSGSLQPTGPSEQDIYDDELASNAESNAKTLDSNAVQRAQTTQVPTDPELTAALKAQSDAVTQAGNQDVEDKSLSTGDMILAAIAGGFGGLAGRPEMGAQAVRDVRQQNNLNRDIKMKQKEGVVTGRNAGVGAANAAAGNKLNRQELAGSTFDKSIQYAQEANKLRTAIIMERDPQKKQLLAAKLKNLESETNKNNAIGQAYGSGKADLTEATVDSKNAGTEKTKEELKALRLKNQLIERLGSQLK
jgi:hypothetical protein